MDSWLVYRVYSQNMCCISTEPFSKYFSIWYRGSPSWTGWYRASRETCVMWKLHKHSSRYMHAWMWILSLKVKGQLYIDCLVQFTYSPFCRSSLDTSRTTNYIRHIDFYLGPVWSDVCVGCTRWRSAKGILRQLAFSVPLMLYGRNLTTVCAIFYTCECSIATVDNKSLVDYILISCYNYEDFFVLTDLTIFIWNISHENMSITLV